MIQFSLDSIDLKAFVYALEETLQRKLFKDVVEAGAKVIEKEYRSILASHAAKPGNPSFTVATKGITSKIRAFKDGTPGAYAVVGAKTVGGRLLSPQLRFGERGTDKRYTKQGEYRGRMPAYHWLKLALANSSDAARQAMITELQAGVSRIRTLGAS